MAAEEKKSSEAGTPIVAYLSTLHTHPLLLIECKDGDPRICDGPHCGNDGKKLAKSYQCLPCNFDLCQDCFEGKSTGSTRKPKRPPAPPPADDRYRLMAMMFHPTNGRDLFTLVSPAVTDPSTLCISLTPAVQEVIQDEYRALSIESREEKLEKLAEMYHCSVETVAHITA